MTVKFNTIEELSEGFEKAGTHCWPILDAHQDGWLVSCTEAGDVFAQGLPFADEDGSNYDRNLVSIESFESTQYPFVALAPVAARTVPSEEAMDESRRISAECWRELRGWIIASHPGYGAPGTRMPMASAEDLLAYVDELRARITKPISDELRALTDTGSQSGQSQVSEPVVD